MFGTLTVLKGGTIPLPASCQQIDNFILFTILILVHIFRFGNVAAEQEKISKNRDFWQLLFLMFFKFFCLIWQLTWKPQDFSFPVDLWQVDFFRVVNSQLFFRAESTPELILFTTLLLQFFHDYFLINLLNLSQIWQYFSNIFFIFT